MDHMGKETALTQQTDKPSSVNLIYSLRSNPINKFHENLKCLYLVRWMKVGSSGAFLHKEYLLKQIIYTNGVNNGIRENETKHSEEIGALAESLKIFQKYKVMVITI